MSTNRNYVLSLVREGDWRHDPWGTAMAWAFACAETLTVMGAEVPESLGYRPSPFVVVETPEDYEPEAHEDDAVWEYLNEDSPEWGDERPHIAEVQFAARCLSRYIDWCVAAGKDY